MPYTVTVVCSRDEHRQHETRLLKETVPSRAYAPLAARLLYAELSREGFPLLVRETVTRQTAN